MRLERRDFVIWIRTLLDLSYRGVAQGGWTGKYPDPATFLDLFQSGSVQSGTGWSDPKFDALLAAADAAPNLAERMQRLAECEKCSASWNASDPNPLQGLLLFGETVRVRMGVQRIQRTPFQVRLD